MTRLFRSSMAVFAATSILALGACGSADSAPAPGEKMESEAEPLVSALGPGTVVSVGGALSGQNGAVYHAVLGARLGTGPICIFPTASADPEGSTASSTASFKRHGGDDLEVIGLGISTDTPELAVEDSVAARISTCSGFWFVGGQQSRIETVLDPDGMGTPALTALIERLEAGAVVSGSSAGAAILSDPMIAGGSSAGALTEGASYEEGAGVRLSPGGGFVHGILMDQHFLARGRFARLVVATLDESTPQVGVGIDENTAFVVEGDEGTVVGGSQVIFVDTRNAVVERSPEGLITSADGIRIEVLSPGDRVDLTTLDVTRGRADAVAMGAAEAPAVPEDPYDGRTIQEYLGQLALSSAMEGSVSGEGLPTLRFTKGAGFVAGEGGYPSFCMRAGSGDCWAGAEEGPPTDPALLTAGPFMLSIGAGG